MPSVPVRSHALVAALLCGAGLFLVPDLAAAQATCASTTPAAQRVRACTDRIASGSLAATDYADALFYRGHGLSQGGDAAGAEANYSAAIAVNPDHAMSYNNRAWIRHERGADEAALPDIERAVALRPENQNLWGNRAVITLALQRYDLALASADRLLALDPAHKGAYAYRARAWLGQGELTRAMTAADQAVRADPTAAYPYIDRAMVYQRQGDDLRAFGDYDAALRIEPAGPRALYGRGLAQVRLGRSADGQADIARARAIQANIAENFAQYGIRP